MNTDCPSDCLCPTPTKHQPTQDTQHNIPQHRHQEHVQQLTDRIGWTTGTAYVKSCWTAFVLMQYNKMAATAGTSVSPAGNEDAVLFY